MLYCAKAKRDADAQGARHRLAEWVMKPSDVWIFVSSVTSEFGAQRSSIAQALRSQGFNVKEQSDFKYEPGVDTLLQKLHYYIRECDAIVAIVGERSGEGPSDEAAADFSWLLPEGISKPSYTQWEVLIGTYYAKRMLLFASNAAFDAAPADAAKFPDQRQVRFIKWLKDRDTQREGFSDPGTLTSAVSKAIGKESWERIAEGEALLPAPIAYHVTRLQAYSLRRLSDIAGQRIESVEKVGQHFAQRVVIDPRARDTPMVLPGEIIRSAELQRWSSHKFDEMLIVGGAGEGKTTIVHSLVCHLAQPRNVNRWGLVPLLASCVTLSRLFGEDHSQDNEALNQWLGVAIAPRAFGEHKKLLDERQLLDFVAALNQGGFRLLLIIDGFDELDPSATLGGNPVERMLTALNHWEYRHKLQPCLRIATTRPYFENIEGLHQDAPAWSCNILKRMRWIGSRNRTESERRIWTDSERSFKIPTILTRSLFTSGPWCVTSRRIRWKRAQVWIESRG